jgi:hypothetical protein
MKRGSYEFWKLFTKGFLTLTLLTIILALIFLIVGCVNVALSWDGDNITPAQADAEARRSPTQIQLTEPPAPPPTQPPEILGPLGKPIAPFWMTGCEEFKFYRLQTALPSQFDGIAWRESNCRNEDAVRTSCCHGYLQLNASLHVQDHRVRDKYHACGVYGNSDINSDNPADKQRHLCAAAALYQVMGTQPWSQTR